MASMAEAGGPTEDQALFFGQAAGQSGIPQDRKRVAGMIAWAPLAWGRQRESCRPGR